MQFGTQVNARIQEKQPLHSALCYSKCYLLRFRNTVALCSLCSKCWCKQESLMIRQCTPFSFTGDVPSAALTILDMLTYVYVYVEVRGMSRRVIETQVHARTLDRLLDSDVTVVAYSHRCAPHATISRRPTTTCAWLAALGQPDIARGNARPQTLGHYQPHALSNEGEQPGYKGSVFMSRRVIT